MVLYAKQKQLIFCARLEYVGTRCESRPADNQKDKPHRTEGVESLASAKKSAKFLSLFILLRRKRRRYKNSFSPNARRGSKTQIDNKRYSND